MLQFSEGLKLPGFTFHCVSGAEIREVDLQAVTGGIIHTKLWVVDQKHFYVGSANMDWRSLSQVWFNVKYIYSAALYLLPSKVRT